MVCTNTAVNVYDLQIYLSKFGVLYMVRLTYKRMRTIVANLVYTDGEAFDCCETQWTATSVGRTAEDNYYHQLRCCDKKY